MTKQNVIIGGGPAATNAVEAIREFDGQSAITLICDEPAHSRMALPYWLAGQIPAEHTHTGDATYFGKLKTDTRIGQRATNIDVAGRKVTLTDGSAVPFDNLLLATGSSPLAPPIPGADLPGVQPLWSLAHTQRVLDAAAGLEKPRVVLVGAGFIGFIVLNAMFKRKWDLAVVERESHVLPRMLDVGGAGHVHSWLESRGVAVHAGTSVKSIRADGKAKTVELANGRSLVADIVILATGIQPNLQLVQGTGIRTDQGILVDEYMKTNVPGIYAAGDIAQGPVLYGDRPAIHAIQPTAVDHGRVAGANMAGQSIRYPGSLLMNIVDVCGLQCASFGAWNDAGAETRTISNTSSAIYRKYLWRGEHLVGAILTGRPNDVGMLTDVGMIKGILQTQTPLGAWKAYLHENPFDVRRVFIATGVPQKLVNTTLLGRPARTRQHQYQGAKPETQMNASHATFVGGFR